MKGRPDPKVPSTGTDMKPGKSTRAPEMPRRTCPPASQGRQAPASSGGEAEPQVRRGHFLSLATDPRTEDTAGDVPDTAPGKPVPFWTSPLTKYSLILNNFIANGHPFSFSLPFFEATF